MNVRSEYKLPSPVIHAWEQNTGHVRAKNYALTKSTAEANERLSVGVMSSGHYITMLSCTAGRNRPEI